MHLVKQGFFSTCPKKDFRWYRFCFDLRQVTKSFWTFGFFVLCINCNKVLFVTFKIEVRSFVFYNHLRKCKPIYWLQLNYSTVLFATDIATSGFKVGDWTIRVSKPMTTFQKRQLCVFWFQEPMGWTRIQTHSEWKSALLSQTKFFSFRHNNDRGHSVWPEQGVWEATQGCVCVYCLEINFIHKTNLNI